jgi:glycosyltransferase involved in cell wall biosynthesis
MVTGRSKVMWLIKGLGLGGAERLLVEALPYIDRETFDYEVAYILPEKNDLVSEFLRASIPVFCLNSRRIYDVGVLPRLVHLLREREVSLLHSHLPYAGILARLASRIARVKAIVYTEHNVLSAYNPAVAFLDRITFRFDDATVAVSQSVNRSARAWPILKPRNLLTIQNGILVNGISDDWSEETKIKESLGVPSHHLLVGNVAHLRPEKGHTFLLKAMQKVIEKRADVSCVVVGREKAKGMLQKLKEYAKELGVQEHVVFVGFREDARELMKAFYVFVLSSLYEGLPIALLEAMALGKPVVVTNTGGVPEVVRDGVEGFLVKPGDPDALADHLLRLIENEDIRKAFSLAAKTKVREQFGIERMVREVEQVYKYVLKRKGTVFPAEKEAIAQGRRS